MIRKFILLFTIGLGLGGVLLFNQQITSAPYAEIRKERVNKDIHSPIIVRPVSSPGAKEAPQTNDGIAKNYQEAVNRLAAKIERLGLDGDELNALFNRVGKEQFLQHLPEEIRAEYRNLEKVITQMQANYLKEDGMSESFFTRYEVEMPDWMKNYREEVEQVNLPDEVYNLVGRLINDREVRNDDVNQILTGCGRGNEDCINRAFALLIDGNHALSDHQLDMIREYL